MKKNVVLTCKVQPHNLTGNCKNTMYELLKTRYVNKSLTIGYIINVNSIKEFIHNKIINGDVHVKMLCECDVYKPTINDIITCKVNMIHINGVFVSTYGIRILLPNTNNIFIIKNNQCIYNNRTININDSINVCIKQIRFENNNYTCIGDIV